MNVSELKEYAMRNGADLVGIANIERFDEVPLEKHPRSILPEAKSVVVLGRRIPRGALRGVEEGTQFQIYRLFGYDWLENRLLALTTYSVVRFLEDHRYEAVPFPSLPVGIPPMGVPVREGAPPPNVIPDLTDAAVRAGLGEIGYCGVLLTPQFGPRQRLQMVITDAPLTPDPIFEGRICDRCMGCVTSCPRNAFFSGREKVMNVCDKTMVVGELDLNKCAGCKNGALPNLYHPAGGPDRLAALCVRSCIDHLEKGGRLTSRFSIPFRRRPLWALDESGRPIGGEREDALGRRG